MTNNQYSILEIKCPFCSKELSSTEYEIALKKLEQELENKYTEQNNLQKLEFENKIKILKEKHEQTIVNNNDLQEKQLKQLQENFEKSLSTQIEIMKKNYFEMLEQNKKQNLQFKKQQETEFKTELNGKIKLINQLKNEQIRLKNTAKKEVGILFEEKERKLQQEIRERDIQITRFSDEIETLKKQLIRNQSELKGEAGEIDLYAKLTQSFPEDLFRRQKRGISTGDIIQQIRIRNMSVTMPIVYDNKVVNQVSKKDIEKAKKYKKIHTTNYVLIVSVNLPKNSVPNGLLGEKEGILLVHPSIVVDVVKQIRMGIVEISKTSKTREDRDTKESKLYNYVTSSDFSLNIESIARINEELYLIQNKEERDHQVLWKKRKELVENLSDNYNDLSSGFESILDTSSIEIKS